MHLMDLLILTPLIILFQRFSTPPTIFVTASHQFPKRPQDAMAVWVEVWENARLQSGISTQNRQGRQGKRK